MKTKLLEVRDIGTTIPLLCIEMRPEPLVWETAHVDRVENRGKVIVEERYCQRYGYPMEGNPSIAICHFALPVGRRITNDPYEWGDRTFATAHEYILDHWDELMDGDVVDVELILGEKITKKQSEILA